MQRLFNRKHPVEHMDGLRELAGVTEPVAVVVRPDGSLDTYGCIGVVDQRPDPSPEPREGQVLTDAEALDSLAALLSAEWNADLCEPVHALVRYTGRVIADLSETYVTEADA